MFDSYLHLQSKVDTLCRKLEQAHQKHLRCGEGCADCCRYALSFSAVELVYIASRLLGDDTASVAVRQALAASDPQAEGPCPLLVNKRCLVYEHRPLLCRSHGLAFVVRESPDDPPIRVTSCELNYETLDLDGLDAGEFVNLDTFNLLLTTVNQTFLQDFPAELPVRLSLHELPVILEFLEEYQERIS